MNRRLVRTWVLCIVGMAITAREYFRYCQRYEVFSSLSASVGEMSPRYLMSPVMADLGVSTLHLLVFFQIGIAILAFDTRARDIQQRFAATFDARPFNNLELLTGRLIGIVLCLSIPFAAFITLIWLFTPVVVAFDAPFENLIEPYSLLAFLTMDLLPVAVIWSAVTMMFALLVRLRIVVFALAVGLALGLYYLKDFLPLYLLQALVPLSGLSIFPSDLVASFTDGAILLQRLSIFLLAAGLLVLSALFYPRHDDSSKPKYLSVGLGLLVLGGGLYGGSVLDAVNKQSEFHRLASVHRSLSDQPRADIVHLGGNLNIRPGDMLELEYQISFLPSTPPSKEVIFAFNPGFALSSITLNEKPANFRFVDGILRVANPQPETQQVQRLNIAAHGRPDVNFGYFDSVLDPRAEPELLGRNLSRLGLEHSIFHDDYVALAPAIKWYPTAGSAYGENDLNAIPRDQYSVELEISVPESWVVAGPGARETLSAVSGGELRYRFAPKASVPEVALFGAPFIRRSTQIADVEFELLMTQKHDWNIALFGNVMPRLREQVSEMFVRANELGIAYPYEMLSVVEVPSSLRIYGGGWRMDSVHSMPGVLLIKETGFPTASFDSRVKRTLQSGQEEAHVSTDRLYQLLKGYFERDFHGGNPFVSASRNFMEFQTAPTGKGATALSYLVNELTVRSITEETGFFSIYEIANPMGFYRGMVEVMSQNSQPGDQQRFVESFRTFYINKPYVWDGASSSALSELDFQASPMRNFKILTLKGQAYADSLLDALSTEQIGRLLAALRKRFAGGSYDYDDFNEVVDELEIDIKAIIGDWLHEHELPGFQLHDPKLMRLSDDDQGMPVYQTTFYLTNETSVPGLVKFAFRRPASGNRPPIVEQTPPLRIDGNSYSRVALQSDHAILQLRVYPYLSLNREFIEVEVEQPDSWEPQDVQALPLIEPVDWRPRREKSIVVDDLDDGFSIVSTTSVTSEVVSPDLQRWQNSYGGAFKDEKMDYDSGIPVWPLVPPNATSWYRHTLPSAWGRYRRTSALAVEGTILGEARFKTELPHAGEWRLEYHFPHGDNLRTRQGEPVGVYTMVIRNGGRSISRDFDVSVAPHGWNELGAFPLDRGEVEVVVSNKGLMTVYADAIRWTPRSNLERLSNEN